MKGFSFLEYVNKTKKIKLKNYNLIDILEKTEEIVENIYKNL
jgi:hypothetical protein